MYESLPILAFVFVRRTFRTVVMAWQAMVWKANLLWLLGYVRPVCCESLLKFLFLLIFMWRKFIMLKEGGLESDIFSIKHYSIMVALC